MSKFNQIEYNNAFNREKYDRITIMVQKGQKDLIKARAQSLGKSLNAYIVDLIRADMEQ